MRLSHEKLDVHFCWWALQLRPILLYLGLKVSVAFHFVSDPVPRNDQWLEENFFAYSATRVELVRISPCDVVVHRHEDNPFLESFWLTSHGFHNFWISWENLQRSEWWWNHPLEFHRLSIDSRQLSVLLNVLKLVQFGFPFFVWLRETDGLFFCHREIDCFVHRGQLFPRSRSPTFFWHSWDFQSLFLNQLLSDIEQFLDSWSLTLILVMECEFSDWSRPRKTAAFIDEDKNIFTK